jgi:hypothetical protein
MAAARDFTLILLEAIQFLLSAGAKFADLIDGKVKGSRPDNKI